MITDGYKKAQRDYNLDMSRRIERMALRQMVPRLYKEHKTMNVDFLKGMCLGAVCGGVMVLAGLIVGHLLRGCP